VICHAAICWPVYLFIIVRHFFVLTGPITNTVVTGLILLTMA
jgi:hypothetical protein